MLFLPCNIFDAIYDAIVSFFDFISNTFEGIVAIITTSVSAIQFLGMFMTYFPAVMSFAITVVIAISIIKLVVGRD